ncbi:MAG: class II aldolase/adducin family protein [Ideonella sp.]
MSPLESRCRALHMPSLKGQVPDAEWLARVELAAAFRAFHDAGWDDLIFTHQSLRVPGADNQFLINPFNLTFDEVTASSLVKIDTAGNVLGDRAAISDVAQTDGASASGGHSSALGGSDAASAGEVPIVINKAGFVIHSAIHMGHPKAHCVMHLHSIAGQAVACAESGLLPITQTSMIASYGGVAYHDFEGIAQDDSERDRLVADMGEHEVMILRNHGTLAIGETVGDAYFRMYYLERACAIQVAAASMNGKVNAHSDDALANTWAQASRQQPWLRRTIGWPAVLRRMLRRHPDIDS